MQGTELAGISVILPIPASSISLPSQDFLIMFVHHLATIGLITFSYINNMVRAGTLVMCLHDASDFLLEVRSHHLSPHYSLSHIFFLAENWLSPWFILIFLSPGSQAGQLCQVSASVWYSFCDLQCCFYGHSSRNLSILVSVRAVEL